MSKIKPPEFGPLDPNWQVPDYPVDAILQYELTSAFGSLQMHVKRLVKLSGNDRTGRFYHTTSIEAGARQGTRRVFSHSAQFQGHPLRRFVVNDDLNSDPDNRIIIINDFVVMQATDSIACTSTNLNALPSNNSGYRWNFQPMCGPFLYEKLDEPSGPYALKVWKGTDYRIRQPIQLPPIETADVSGLEEYKRQITQARTLVDTLEELNYITHESRVVLPQYAAA